MNHFCYLCFVFVILSCLVITCWERTNLLALLYMKLSCVLWCPESGVVLDCIDY